MIPVQGQSNDESSSNASSNGAIEDSSTENALLESPTIHADSSLPSSDDSTPQVLVPYVEFNSEVHTRTVSVASILESITYTLDGTHSFQLEHSQQGRRELEAQRRYTETSSNSLMVTEDGPRNQEESDLKIFGDYDQLMFRTVLGTGAVLGIAQGIQILATLLSVTPAWLHIDPLNIVAGKLDEEEADGERSEGEKLFDR